MLLSFPLEGETGGIMSGAQTGIVSAMRPTRAALGYGLFLAVNASSVWGGVFPFLPMGFQTHSILLCFFLTQASVFAVAFLASVLGVYRMPRATRRFLVPAATAPYFIGWWCLIGAIYLDAFALPLVVAGGALIGFGSAGYYMMWQRLFAARPPEVGNRNLIAGTAYGAVIYMGLCIIPRAVTAFLVPLVFLPLFGLAVILESRQISLAQPMFEDIPREHPGVYRRVISDTWRSALCMGALGFCTGVMRSMAITEPAIGSLVNIISMAALFVAALAFMVLWVRGGFVLNVLSAFRVVFPVVITAFLLLAFLPGEYALALAALLYALHGVALLLMMFQCGQLSRDRGINPVFVYGVFGGIVYALHDVGFIGATVAGSVNIAGMYQPATVALGSVYILGIMLFIGQGGLRAAGNPRADGNSVEMVAYASAPVPVERDSDFLRLYALSEEGAVAPRGEPQPVDAVEGSRPMGEIRKHPADGASGGFEAAEPAAPPAPSAPIPAVAHAAGPEPDDHVYSDRTSKRVELLRRTRGLSMREAEVVDLLVRGNTVARIAETLYVSENTVRTHTKRIYVKLGIHKRQELNDLLDSLDLADLG